MSAAAERRRYRRAQALVPMVLVAYLVVAWSDWWVPGRAYRELFPFYSWDLFSKPNAYERLYTVRITAVRNDDERAADLLGRPITDLGEARFLRDERFHKTAHKLARAVRDEDVPRRDQLAAQLANFMRPLGVTGYDLMVLKYHPLRYYRGEEQPDPEPVASFSLGR